jgi:hypothetical protein
MTSPSPKHPPLNRHFCIRHVFVDEMFAQTTHAFGTLTVMSVKSTFVNSNAPRFIKTNVEFQVFAPNIQCVKGSATRSTQSFTANVPFDENEMNGMPSGRLSNA